MDVCRKGRILYIRSFQGFYTFEKHVIMSMRQDLNSTLRKTFLLFLYTYHFPTLYSLFLSFPYSIFSLPILSLLFILPSYPFPTLYSLFLSFPYSLFSLPVLSLLFILPFYPFPTLYSLFLSFPYSFSVFSSINYFFFLPISPPLYP